MKKLYRSKRYRWLGGVVGGFAEYFSIDPNLLRVIIIILSIILGWVGELLLAYVLALIIIPSKQTFSEQIDEQNSSITPVKQYQPEFIIGIILLIIGSALLLRQFIPMQWLQFNRFLIMPALMIFAGVLIIFRGKK